MKRNKFDLSHYKLATFDMGELIPVQCLECLPGDTFDTQTSLLLRVSPLVAPVMHPVMVRIHHWFVPNRLLWTGWEDFITGGWNGLGDGVGAPPTHVGPVSAGSLYDYLGAPVTAGNLTKSLLPVRAYNLIWNEGYRDEDLQVENSLDLLSTSNVCWEKDYMTTARPWAQRGNAVSLPLGTTAPVRTSSTQQISGAQAGLTLRRHDTGAIADGVVTVGNDGLVYETGTSGAAVAPYLYPSNLQADLSSATAATVNDLRRAMALQRYAEARAKYGARYTEYLRYLGVNPRDGRMQKPEYIGGGRQVISFSEVLQMGPDSDNTGVGRLKGHGIAALRSNRSRRYCEEHGFLITLASVLPKTMYTQGLHRMFSRTTKEDFYQKELEFIGQQEVYSREVYADGTAGDSGVFGYQDRYDEYRRVESGVSGEFRSTLNFWHMGRQFGSRPTLNSSFVQADPTKRVHAVQSNDTLWVMVNNRTVARRMVAPRGEGRIV